MSSLKDMYRTVLKDTFPDTMTITLGDAVLTYKKRTWHIDGETKGLRYGENPDQPAALYEMESGKLAIDGVEWRGPQGIMSALTEAQMLQAGKHPGKTNLTDVDNGANILQYLSERPAAIILKHNNPCGAAWDDGGVAAALAKAFWCDRIAAFGGAVVVNRPLDRETAELMAANYLEVVCAPDFEEGVLAILARRKNLRVIRMAGIARLAEYEHHRFVDFKSLIDGGIIVQRSAVNSIRSAADLKPAKATYKGATYACERQPTEREIADMLFGWAVEHGVTSNSVIYVKDGCTVAIGAGEQDRVGVAEIAVHKAYAKYADVLCFDAHGLPYVDLVAEIGRGRRDPALQQAIDAQVRADRAGLPGAVMISDAFFPFRDAAEVGIREGVSAILQAGGSIRDFESIQACNEARPQVAMLFTGQRSFKH